MGTIINTQGRTFMWDITENEARNLGMNRAIVSERDLPMEPFLLSSKRVRAKEVIAELEREYKQCRLCPLKCGTDRTRHTPPCSVFLYPSYFICDTLVTEESIISPTFSVFFQGCNLRCVYCQAQPKGFSRESGSVYHPLEIAGRISSSSARTLSFIGGNPDNHIKAAVETILHLEKEIPVVWNSNLYVNRNMLDYLDRLVEIYTIDLKAYKKCGEVLCGPEDYFAVVSGNIRYLLRSQPYPLVIIRHLMVPGHFECCTRPILHWIKTNAPHAMVNVMTGYYPRHLAKGIRGLDRILTEGEISKANELADALSLDIVE